MKPIVQIWGGGVDLFGGFADRLLNLRITDQQGYKSDRLEITIDDTEPWVEFPAQGQELIVMIGYAPGIAEPRYNGVMIDMGLFIVDEVEYSINPDVIHIIAHANDTGSTFKKSKTRSWDKKTIGSIVQQIAKEHKLQAKVGKELASKKIEHIDQTTQSDQGFLSDLARDNDGCMKVVNKTILFGKKGTLRQLAGKGEKTVTVDRTDCASATFLVNARSAFTGARAKYHDEKQAKEYTVEVGDPDNVIGNDPIYPTKEEATDAAKAKKNSQDRAVETVNLTCVGDPRICAEANLITTGFRPGLRTKWIIKQAVHNIDGSGTYSTDVEGELPEAARDSVKGRASGPSNGKGGGGGAKKPKKAQPTGNEEINIFISKPDKE